MIIAVSKGSSMEIVQMKIELTDENDNAPIFTQNVYHVYKSESDPTDFITKVYFGCLLKIKFTKLNSFYNKIYVF